MISSDVGPAYVPKPAACTMCTTYRAVAVHAVHERVQGTPVRAMSRSSACGLSRHRATTLSGFVKT